MNPESLQQRLIRYFEKAEKKFASITVVREGREADLLLSSARNYFSDARHFREQGDLISSLAALEYAEGFVDAARVLGLIHAEHTGELD